MTNLNARLLLSTHMRILWLLVAGNLISCNSRQVCVDRTAVYNTLTQISALSKASGRPAWPPNPPTYYRDPISKRITLALRPIVLPNSHDVNLNNYWFDKLAARYCGKKLTGSWFQQIVIMNNYFGRNAFGKNSYDFYPPMLDVKAIVDAMRSGKPMRYPPVDDPSIQLMRVPNTCSAKDRQKYDLIVMIYSCVNCPNNRRWARNSYMKKTLWRKLKVGFFFVLGMPATVNRRTVRFEGLAVRQQPSYPRGTRNRLTLARKLLQEADKYKDMLVGNFQDEFFSAPLRTILGFRWAALFCSQRTPLFLIIDPGYVIVPYNAVQFVKKIRRSSKRQYCAGHMFPRMSVARAGSAKVTSNKYAVSYRELPWKYYPPFASRVALFMGSNLLNEVTIAMMYTRRFRFADVYLGIVLYRLRRKVRHIKAIHFNINDETCKKALGGFYSSTIRRVDWKTGKSK